MITVPEFPDCLTVISFEIEFAPILIKFKLFPDCEKLLFIGFSEEKLKS